jgi:hypothetical protein
MAERFESEAVISAAMPPPEFWLHDPRKDGKLDVEYDDLGRVDLDKTIDTLLSKFGPEFDFARESTLFDDHHGQHDENKYASTPNERVNPRQYRRSASRRVGIPRMVHAVLHNLFNEPRMTEDWVMRGTIDAQLPLTRMRQSYDRCWEIALGTLPGQHNAEFRDQLAMRMDYYKGLLDELRSVPPEFQLVQAEDIDIYTVDDVIAVARAFRKYTFPHIPIPIPDDYQGQISSKIAA